MDKLLSLASEYDMLPSGAVVLCALSGGADSICLTHALHARSQELGFTLHAAHFNHHLRGEQSDRDAAFAAAWCAERGIPCHLGEGRVADLDGNTEENARTLRYRFLRQTAERLGAARIATAHNADDNLETLLLNLTRGCGLNGLAGIPPRRGEIVRPLLTTSRREIEAYLAQHGLAHVEDATNADQTYSRNRLRHQVLPVLRQLNPRLDDTAVQTIRLLRQDNDYLTARAMEAAQAARWAEDDLVIRTEVLSDLPGAVAPRCARLLLERMGDGDARCSGAHLDSIVALARGDDPSGVLFLPDGLLVQRVYDDLLFTTQAPPEPFAPISLHEGENPIPGTGWKITVTGPALDLTARPRRTGDELRLPGRENKTVKKLFIDEKVPRRVREQIPVVADGDGVLFLAGFGPNTDHPRAPAVKVTAEHSTKAEKDG